MEIIINILAFVFSLGIIIAIHEWGHFIFAKRANILCHEYAIGMGPVVYQKKKRRDTIFQLEQYQLVVLLVWLVSK